MRLTLPAVRTLIVRGSISGVLLFLLAGAIGCGDADYRPEAVGQEGTITVVMDSSRWNGPVGDAFRDEVATYIETLPAPERSFDLSHVNIESNRQFERVKTQKNLIFVAPLSDSTNEAKYLKSILSDEAEQAIEQGGSAVVPRRDEWRRRQQVVFVTAATPEALVQTLREKGSSIRSVFNVATRERMYREMYDRGRQRDVEQQLMDAHGFAVDVQHDYLIAMDTTNFVWLRRILPETWRSLFVYYEENADPSDLTPEWVYATRDSLTRKYVQGNLGGWVEVVRSRPLDTEEVNFLDRFAYETRGLWEMVGEENGEKFQFGMGGPFLNYSFYDQDTGRLYMIDGMVFAPSYKKREFLRQMEVIAHTFRTAAEAAPEEPVASSE